METNFSSRFDSGRDGDVPSAFEKRLHAQPLGSLPANRDEILYRCGYAAGMALSEKRHSHYLNRWRFVGIAASIVAAFSLSTQFALTNFNQHRWSDYSAERVPPIDAQKVTGNASAYNFALLLTERTHQKSDENSSYQTTALFSKMQLEDFVEQDRRPTARVQQAVFPSANENDSKLLQPKDSLSVLTGEA